MEIDKLIMPRLEEAKEVIEEQNLTLFPELKKMAESEKKTITVRFYSCS